MTNLLSKIKAKFPSYTSTGTILFSSFFILTSSLLTIDFFLPKQFDIAYVYDVEFSGNDGILVRSDNTANFVIESNQVLLDDIGVELYVYKTPIFGRIDPIVSKSDHTTFNVCYNLRSTYFIPCLLTLLLSVLMIYIKPSKGEDISFQGILGAIIIILQIVIIMLNFNALLLLGT
ncbi:hypothetical protein [Flammeovirga kamogawensis]|uniref:Uncharacterized protein n=1 Tax=Flammeovirga kamogawensis TaxID=373891 RepID=A0ABX8GZC8_9BACT|nr:hypothetical protein [Flammeovirga kamogawensis]MBB6459416.1 hypothetical protein [Flammeovirga kamogawensis]QWG08971.1 hypothetical protein KM029_08510 [Flammeovirga kamogawensis]TRX67261.1 hypothetical protein EO216_03555 [Flammeovirga kamogawensis]